MYTYFPANRTAGYSGFVVYVPDNQSDHLQTSYWMIPGTFFDDWDNMPIAIALLD